MKNLFQCVAVVALALFAYGALAPAQRGPAKVYVASVEFREVSAGRMFVGSVMPRRSSIIGSAASGRVEKLYVDEGDRVKKGQPLAKLRTKIIQAQVDAAKADLALRQAELDELKNGYRQEEIHQAKAKLALAEAVLAMRQSRRNRDSKLIGRGTSREDYEEAIALANQATALRREAAAYLKLVEDGPRKEKIDQGKAKVGVAEAEVRRLTEQMKRHTIVAPFDGFVVAEHAEVGQWVLQGAPVAEVVDLDFVEIEINVVENYIPQLKHGTPVRVDIHALPKKVFTGKVDRIVPRANIRTRTFPVQIVVKNEPSNGSVLLKAGMFGKVTLPVGGNEKGILVPKDALVLGGPTPVVFIAEGGKVRAVPVQLGVADDNMIQVKGDLKQGQLVVVQGNERLRPGQAVEAIKK